ncbi:MAG: TylF/MycF/NovP-related O-methyltransferase [Lachnospiraceae bacterium]
MANRIKEQDIPGSIAELGVYRGDIAWQLNALFPERELLLFDTFQGFDAKDVKTEKNVLFQSGNPELF